MVLIDPNIPRTSNHSIDEAPLLQRLRNGDNAVFTQLVETYQGTLIRIAGLYVADPATIEEVVQETCLGVLRGIAGFEGRSSFKTWLFRILTNTAKSVAQREHRTMPFSAFESNDMETEDPIVDPTRFHPADHPRWPGHWADNPQP
jgi:RNA polymerase sigma-70 factor (ECF subfamily)